MTNEEIKKEEEKYLDGLEHKISDHDSRVKELAMRLIDDDFDEQEFYALCAELEKIFEVLYEIKSSCMHLYRCGNDRAFDVHYKAYLVERIISRCELLMTNYKMQFRKIRHN